MRRKISIVIPIYNEVLNIPIMVHSIEAVFSKLDYDYNIIYVDDGSKDDTIEKIKNYANQNKNIRFISFSRNFGHQNALKAGIDLSDGDAVISMDGDMQHPPTLIPQLIKKWEEGNDIVYTIRLDTDNTSFVKKTTSNLFYQILNKLSSVELEKGTADFRLLDKKVVNVFREIKESDLFWRGLVKWMGFNQISIQYTAGDRVHGKSKYTYKKMKDLALKGITSFSTKPLSIAIYIGLVSSLASILFFLYAFISYHMGHVISGWTSIIIAIAFFGGLQLMVLGIVGLYLGKLFMQSKNRPQYIIKETNIS